MTRTKKEDSSEFQSPQSLEHSIARIEQLLLPARRVAEEMARLKTGPILIGTQPSFHWRWTTWAAGGRPAKTPSPTS